MRKLGAIVMLGAGGQTHQEQLVANMQQAATIDLILLLRELKIQPIILCSPKLDWWPDEIHIWLAPDPANRPFHFGEHLAETIIANQLDQVLYFGGASAPLLDFQMHRLLLDLLKRSGNTRIALCNNLHSGDWIAINNATEALPIIHQANRDNSLAWMLREDAHYQVRILTEMRQAAAFDLDTPTDFAIIRQHPECAPNLRQATAVPELGAIPVGAVLNVLATTASHVALIGRVPPRAWESLSSVTQCWIRVFSEERGMVASERYARGEVSSLLGKLLDLQGPHQFFQTLADIVDAAIIDSRIFMAHRGLKPSDADRFASDLYMTDAISDPWLREFTAAAAEAPIPIILGGHSAVAGGLYVLSEILQLRKARPH